MKSFMIFLNFVTFLVVGLLIFVHVVHKEPQPEPVLSVTPDSPTNKVEAPIQNNPPYPLPLTESLVKTNIFHPDRGKVAPPEVDPAVPSVKPESLELVGTFTFGNKVGAIIKEQPTAVKKPEESGEATRKIFYINDKMTNGCTLKKVEPTLVVMEQNGTEFKLYLDLADKGSQERQSKVVAIKPMPVVINAKPGPIAQPPPPAGPPAATPPPQAQIPVKPSVTTPVPPSPPPKGRFVKK